MPAATRRSRLSYSSWVTWSGVLRARSKAVCRVTDHSRCPWPVPSRDLAAASSRAPPTLSASAARPASADGAANSSYDSFASLGGAVLMFNMMLGEVAPGGAGSGLYGLVMMVLLAVFIGGLMVGRTPEYLRQRLRTRHMKLVSLYILALPAAVLIGTAVAMSLPGERASMLNAGPHGLSEVLYAFTSAAANNGSAFAGFSGNTAWYNTALALAMVVGRFLPIIAVLAIAGTFAQQRQGVVTAGTLRTHSPTFIWLIVSATLLVVGLEYLPALALGPLADGL